MVSISRSLRCVLCSITATTIAFLLIFRLLSFTIAYFWVLALLLSVQVASWQGNAHRTKERSTHQVLRHRHHFMSRLLCAHPLLSQGQAAFSRPIPELQAYRLTCLTTLTRTPLDWQHRRHPRGKWREVSSFTVRDVNIYSWICGQVWSY
jgi:hypothetical protein